MVVATLSDPLYTRKFVLGGDDPIPSELTGTAYV